MLSSLEERCEVLLTLNLSIKRTCRNRFLLQGMFTFLVIRIKVIKKCKCKKCVKIKKLGQSGHLEFRSSEIGNGEREISEKNLKYLLKVAKQISREDSNDRSFCLRSHFKMKIKTAQKDNIIKYGCIGSKTTVIEKMNNYANLMAMMI